MRLNIANGYFDNEAYERAMSPKKTSSTKKKGSGKLTSNSTSNTTPASTAFASSGLITNPGTAPGGVIPASRKWSDIVGAYFPAPLPQTMKKGGLVRGNGCAKRGRGKGTMR
jgi:hypothetical protein